MTTLIFVRHGQSTANLDHIFAGYTDAPLTELGHKQAELTAAYLDSYSIDHIYASDLKRAYQTAEHTANRRNMPIIAEPLFREIYAGEWEGMTFEAIAEQYSESHEVWKKALYRAHPEGGESVVQLSDRIQKGVQRVLEKHRGETVAIFTHATPIRTLAWRWLGCDIHVVDEKVLEVESRVNFCPNASVSIAEYEDDGSFRLICYGHGEHLKEFSTELPKNLV